MGTLHYLLKTLARGTDRAFDADPVTCWLATLSVILILAFGSMTFRYMYKIKRDRNRVRHDILRTIRELNQPGIKTVKANGLWAWIFRRGRWVMR